MSLNKKNMANSPKNGLLLVNLGTPDSPTRWDVYRYLREFLTDARVIDYPWLARQALVQGIIAPLRSGSSAKLYKQLWTPTGSPLKAYGIKVADGLKEILDDTWHVELAMRYQNPSISDAWKRLKKQNITHLYVLPLFPQYASATTGSVHDEVMRILRKEQSIPGVTFINSYCDYEPMIQIAKELDLKEGSYTTTFQSRLGPDKWAQPYTSVVLDHSAEAGAKKLLVFSPAFVADCLETLIEISVEYQEEFVEKGGERVDLVPSLNDDPRWISALKDLVLSYAK